MRISILKIAAFAILLSLPGSVLGQKNEAEARAIAAYPMTMDLVSRYFESLRDLTRLFQSDAGLKNQFAGWEDLPLDARIRKIDTSPKMTAVLKAHGISSRDHVMTGVAVMAAMIVVANIGDGAKGPNDANRLEWAATPSDHIKFYQTHHAEIQKLQQSFMEAMKK